MGTLVRSDTTKYYTRTTYIATIHERSVLCWHWQRGAHDSIAELRVYAMRLFIHKQIRFTLAFNISRNQISLWNVQNNGITAAATATAPPSRKCI